MGGVGSNRTGEKDFARTRTTLISGCGDVTYIMYMRVGTIVDLIFIDDLSS